ncbi:DUF3054 domain-containing protein [Corynebacterium sp. ES2794-CONJ1]|uniref:DUF3054 domain-containing protein n=1 Tax=unclassified Corynebacterium TaxID=2624378 RepID=UPI002169F57C|nr:MULTISPECIES: DUF3054 domain-containing protein [unclassified Corynebacterium]MCS4490145.1 DUF3054 domain-containing protein [Corynebacterium sp. ES2775-CONJ]MCS4492043.1 DUF3054 domain-containing protein [Corynebacterium sp. ES2715-CONJ3]MCS4532148.1 DUF3054 domain-containing protein [Corynebacterium sp. ES2730-CONJ]MCU9519550.1 DUF3054 domain-containing protein [Corynebacterium sp. ES2794-CONJ1]
MKKFLAYDLLAVGAFAFLARLAHGGIAPLAVLGTWWPFALGALTGGGIIAATRENGFTPKNGVIVWLSTVVVGLGIWTARHHALPHWSFITVASTMSGLLLLGWRLVAARVSRRS